MIDDIQPGDLIRIKDVYWHKGWREARGIVLKMTTELSIDDEGYNEYVHYDVMMFNGPNGVGVDTWNADYITKVC